MKINQFIAFYRKAKGYTQEQLANEVGVSANTFSQYETGKRNVPQDILSKLCRLLNFSFIMGTTNQMTIKIIFENEELAQFVHHQVKEKYGMELNFSPNCDDEYPENFLLNLYEEENRETEMDKLIEEFGEDILDGIVAKDFIFCDIFQTNNLSCWNIHEEHEGYPGYEGFRTVVEFTVET